MSKELTYETFFQAIKDNPKTTKLEPVFEVQKYEENVTKYQRNIAGVLKPESSEQVVEIVKLANQFSVPIYPISRGGNWAFGSCLPVTNNCVVLDLQLLNKIADYNKEAGTVRIGPGVSQGQLSDYLTEIEASHFLDVTGSGYHSSVLGNALERGIAYNSLRANRIGCLEIVLASGEIIHTGFLMNSDAEVGGVYPYGVGPSIDQLFFQSNYGVVLSATYQLHSIPEQQFSLQVKFQRDQLQQVMEALRYLKHEDVLSGIAHVADPVRMGTTVCPLLPANHRQEYWEETLNKKEWSAIINIRGPKDLNKAKIKLVKKKLRKIAKVTVFNEKKIALARKIFSFLKITKQVNLMDATQGLRGLPRGKATSDALYMSYFDVKKVCLAKDVPGITSKEPQKEVRVDDSPVGVVFCVPLAVNSGKHAEEMYSIVQQNRETQQLIMGVTLNIIGPNLLEAVISIHYGGDEAEKATAALKTLYQELIASGYLPYRLNPEIMDLFSTKCESTLKLKQELKKLLDPNSIIAPGRYEN